jgi:hypothetical protein
MRRKLIMNRASIISVFLVGIILISTSCVSGVSQEEHQRVKNELSTVQGELASLKVKLAEAVATLTLYEGLNNRNATLESAFDAIQTRHEELSAKYDELNIKYDTLQSDYEALQSTYEELSTEYKELSKQNEVAIEEVEAIVQEDVEQALLELINEARVENGLDILLWKDSLHKLAKDNSIDMATYQDLRYPDSSYEWREVYWATGYNSAAEIAEATYLIWKNRDIYEKYFLWDYLEFGAVGVHKSGHIFYITYISDHSR